MELAYTRTEGIVKHPHHRTYAAHAMRRRCINTPVVLYKLTIFRYKNKNKTLLNCYVIRYRYISFLFVRFIKFIHVVFSLFFVRIIHSF